MHNFFFKATKWKKKRKNFICSYFILHMFMLYLYKNVPLHFSVA
ncbi:hypothetical protein [Plasmodium yoelii yoelii]|uniref:Uncharacterized protein n=1 Tax=Plasmodium yoelii yoelii TaxID=73239 RepID=Q7RDV8_PLAYO|nr:hypothetical protein [Plasmodium yoelii yoelii]